MVYRLLFILRGESGGRETPPFPFASTSLWRNTYSPSRAQPGNLAWVAQKVREEGMASGQFLEAGLRALFQAFEHGLDSTELHLAPLGGALFGEKVTPLLDELKWGEQGCAELLDNLLRAPRGKGKARSLVRLSYRDLDVEELGRVYEALLELESGITSEPMVRLRRAKLEVVAPEAQGEKYRDRRSEVRSRSKDEAEIEDEVEAEDDEPKSTISNQKSKIEWIEQIAPNRFYLRVGLGRKSSGGHYTPDSFVRFLVQETLGPLCDAKSPTDDPQPMAILRLKVLDGAMGSGHILVGACRFLGERLYDACRACAERGLWERVPDEIAPYLPGRRPEGESEAGLSAERARALCKRLVAVHCLYGVDKNPLAVQLACVSLWLESFAEGLPLTFLDHRLVCGDSLLGPVNILGEGPDSPMTPPYATAPMDVALAQGVRAQLRERLGTALQKVRELDATVGVSVEDLLAKQKAKADLDALLAPFIDLCVAWSGGVMLGQEHVDEDGYRDAMRLAASGKWSVERGALSDGFLAMLKKGREAGVLVYPLVFPEVFFPTGDVEQMTGFDVIIENPPWERPEISEPDFWVQYDLRAADIRLQRERDALIAELRANYPRAATAWGLIASELAGESNIATVLYHHQSVDVSGKQTVGRPDLFRLFAERCQQLLTEHGFVGLVVPSAFHANEGATGIRRLYLYQMAIQRYFSFENRRKLFEIDGRFKFSSLVARRDILGTGKFEAGFYLHDDSWLFLANRGLQQLSYSRDFIELTGGQHLTFVECRHRNDQELTGTLFENSATTWGDFLDTWNISTTFGVELHRNRAFAVPLVKQRRSSELWRWASQDKWKNLPVHEGKSIFQYTDEAEEMVRVSAPAEVAIPRRHWAQSVPYYRFAFRQVAASTNERTFIATIISPGFLCNHNVGVESTPADRRSYYALLICGLANSYLFDWLVRSRVGASVNPYLIRPIPVPDMRGIELVLVHSALRLVCNHEGYAPLWAEQLGDEWRESTPRHTWPVLAGDDVRWRVRAAIDAVVTQAYGLSREQYEHVLRSFDRASGPNPHTGRCLAMWDELHSLGLDAFTRKYDPYWDVPLVETLPMPVITLPALRPSQGEGAEDEGQPNLFGEITQPKRSRRSKR